MTTHSPFITTATLLLSAVLALGCTPTDGAVTDSADDTDTDTTDGSAETDGSEATAGPTTDTTGETGETDGAVPAACSETDPATAAVFNVFVDGDDGVHDIDLACTVGAVATEAAMSVTTLTCDDGGTSRAVAVHLPVAPEGEVSWAAGESVKLTSKYENFEVTSEKLLELRGADDALLAAGLAWAGAFIPEIFAPIAVELVVACGPASAASDGRDSYQLDFELEGQPPLSLFSGNRSELTIDASESFAVDVESAIYNDCCHSNESFTMLVRRVKTG